MNATHKRRSTVSIFDPATQLFVEVLGYSPRNASRNLLGIVETGFCIVLLSEVRETKLDVINNAV